MSAYLTPGIRSLQLRLDTPIDSDEQIRDDLIAVKVWYSTQANFDVLTQGTLAFNGLSLSVAITNLTADTIYYVRYAFISAIDPDAYTISDTLSGSPVNSISATIYNIDTTSPVIVKTAPDAATSGDYTPITIVTKKYDSSTTDNYGFITVTANGEIEAAKGIRTPFTLTPSASSGKSSYTIKMYSQETVDIQNLLDTQTIPVVFNGATGVGAISASISNDTFIFNADVIGLVPDTSYTGSGTEIRVYEGATQLSYDETGTSKGTWKVATAVDNITCGTITKTGVSPAIPYAVVGKHSGVATTTDTSSITYTITGKTYEGTAFTITKTQTFSKSKAGTSPLIYNIVTSSPIITKQAASASLPGDYSEIIIWGKQYNGNKTIDSGYITITSNLDIAEPTVGTSVATNPITLRTNSTSGISSYTLRLYSRSGVTDSKALGEPLDTKIISVVYKGDTGNAGADAITTIISNDTFIFNADTAGAVPAASYVGSGTVIKVYEGGTELAFTGVGTISTTSNSSTWKVATVSTNIIRGTVSITGVAPVVPYATVADHSGVSTNTDASSITYTITGKNSLGNIFSITKTQTFSKSKAGTNPLIYSINTSSPVIFKDAPSATTVGTYTSIDIQGKRYNGSTTDNYGWVTITSDLDPDISTTTFNTASGVKTLIPATGTSSYTIRLLDSSTWTTANILDTQIIPVIFKGATGLDGIIASISNDNFVFTTDTAGKISATGYNGSGTQIRVYEGAKELSYTGTGSATSNITNGTWKIISTVTVSNITAGTISITSIPPATPYATISDHSAVPDAANSSTITYTIIGKTTLGVSFTLTKTQSFSKSKRGTSPLIYSINTDPVIFKDATNATTSGIHTGITVQGKRYDGSTTDNYGWISITGNGDTESTTLINTDPTAKAFTPDAAAGKSSYTIKLYTSSTASATSLVDTQIVPVVFKGSTGVGGLTAVLSNDTFTFTTDTAGKIPATGYSGSGTQIRVYEGATLLSYSTAATIANSSWKVDTTTIPSVNITPGTLTASTNYVTINNHSGVADNVDTSIITYTITGKNSSGIDFTITKTQTFSKTKSGSSPLVYDITTSSPVIFKDAPDANTDGIYSSIVIQGKQYDGNTTTNFGYVTITSNLDTTENTSMYKTTTGAGYTFTPPNIAGTSSYTIKLYNTANYVTGNVPYDTQVIPVVFKGAKGNPGDTGVDAITAIASNETFVFSADDAGKVTAGTGYIGSGTVIRVYQGAKELTYDGTGTATSTWKVTSSSTNITASAPVDSGAYATFPDHTAMLDAAESATITYTISGKDSKNIAFTLTKTQSFSKSKRGTAPLIYSINTDPVIFKDAPNATTSGIHTGITVQGKRYNGSTTDSYGWISITGNGDTESTTLINTDPTAKAFTPDAAAGKSSYTIKLYTSSTASATSLVDTQIVPVVFKGSTGVGGLTAVLSNDTFTFNAQSDGSVPDYTNSGTDIRVYEGGTELSYNTTVANGNWQLTTSGTNIIPGAIVDKGTYANIVKHSGVDATIDTSNITYTIVGKTSLGADFTITKNQTFSKTKSGTSPLVYDITTTSPVIVKNAPNAATSGVHSSITIQGKKYDGSTTTNFGYITITSNLDTTENTTLYSTSTGSGKVFTPADAAGTSSYTIRLYSSSVYVANTTPLDTQTIPVVFNGTTGANAIYIQFKNENFIFGASASGDVTTYAGSGAEIRIYEGTSELSFDGTGAANSIITNGTWKIVSPVAVTNITCGTISKTGTSSTIPYAAIADHSNVAANIDNSSITYTIIGKSSTGAAFTIVRSQNFVKAKSGSGTRGSRSIYSSSPLYVSGYDFPTTATSLIKSAVTGSYPTDPITGDTVTFTNTSTTSPYVYTLTYSNSAWAVPGQVIDGSLITTGSITTAKLNTNGLEVKDANGNVILSATTKLSASRIDAGTISALTLTSNDNNFIIDFANKIISISV